MVRRQDIPNETKLAVEKEMRVCPGKQKTEEPLDRLYAFYLFCSKGRSRKEIAKSLGKPRHLIEDWIRDLAKATPERIVAMARCKYTFSDGYCESGRRQYSESIRIDGPITSAELTHARKELYSILPSSGINETCFVTPDNKMYFNEDGKKLICDMLMNRVKRDLSDQNQFSFEAYSDIRDGHFDIKHRSHYNWMLELACSNLRDLSVTYPDSSGATEYYTEDEVRSTFWRHACLVNQNYDVLPGMSLLGELPEGFYEETHDAILDDIITTFDPLIVAEFENYEKHDHEKLEHIKQRWIEYLYCVSDIRNEYRQKVMKELKDDPALCEVLEMFVDGFLSIFDWDSFRKKTRTLDLKWGSGIRKTNREKTKNWRRYLALYRKKPEKLTEDERDFLALMHEAGKRCAKIGPPMPIEEVIELANMRLQGKEKGSVAEDAAIDT